MFHVLRRNLRRSPSYGGPSTRCQPRGWFRSLAGAGLLVATAQVAEARTLHVVAFGDSLMAGYHLPAGGDYPAHLEAALRRNGLDVAITNASVSGDTTAGGLERLDWSVPDGTDGLLLELGANDMLRGQDPAITKGNLATMIDRLKARHVAVYLLGMKANPTLGPDYVGRFDAVYPDLAKADGLPLDPFFLDGVAGQAALQLPDGLHPNPDGVAHMVDRTAPGITAWLKQLDGQR